MVMAVCDEGLQQGKGWGIKAWAGQQAKLPGTDIRRLGWAAVLKTGAILKTGVSEVHTE